MESWKSLRRIWTPFTSGSIPLFAAGASFYILLSLLPATVFLLALLPYLPVTSDAWNRILQEIIPAPFLPLAFFLLQTAAAQRSPAVLSLSALTTLWSASRGILALSDGLNAVLELQPTRQYVVRRLRFTFYFLLLELSLLMMLGIYVFGRQLLGGCLQWFPEFSELFRLILRLRSVCIFFLLCLLFSAVYRFFPAERLPFRFCLAGGLLAAAGWIVISLAFSIYVNYVSFRNRLYGGFGLVILAGFWLHSCMVLLLSGGLLTKLLTGGTYRPILFLKESFFRRS